MNENFKKWFGNSKVVDDKGTPRVVYHGTTADFDSFKNPTKAMATKVEREQPIFFSSDAETASAYAGKSKGANVYPVYLRIEKPFNPFNLSEETIRYFDDLIYEESIKEGRTEDEAEEDAYQWIYQLKQGSWGILESEEVWKYLKDNNYDGFITREMGAINYGVLSPLQVKSAIGNNGDYDPSNPDITMREGGKVNGYFTGYLKHLNW